MGQVMTGIGFILFGFLVGGIGLATAGIGIGIPMIPIGIYLTVRGLRSFSHEEKMSKTKKFEKQEVFETTMLGKFSFGILLIIIGLATSALIIGIPLIFVGAMMIFSNFYSN